MYLANKLIDIGCDNYDNRVAKVCYAIENIIDDIEKYLVLFVFFISIFGGHYIRFSIIEIYVLLLIIVILIFLFAPLPSRNRPLYKKSLRRKFKVQGIIGVCIVFVICNLGKYDSVGVLLLIQIAEVLIRKIKLII